MSCDCSNFANIYTTLFTFETNFNNLTGNILYNYNQLTRISSQQSNIINLLSNNNGTIISGNIIVFDSANISRNMILNNGNININKDLFLSNVITLGTDNGSSGQSLLSSGNSSYPIYNSPVLKNNTISLSGIGIVEFLDIPSWVHEITIIVNNCSTSTISDPLIQVGTSSAYITSGYTGSIRGNDGPTGQLYSTTIRPWNNTAWATTNVFNCIITFYLVSSNTWVFELISSRTDTAYIASGCGSITLSSSLNKIKFYTGSGISPDLFDSGSVVINYN